MIRLDQIAWMREKEDGHTVIVPIRKEHLDDYWEVIESIKEIKRKIEIHDVINDIFSGVLPEMK